MKYSYWFKDENSNKIQLTTELENDTEAFQYQFEYPFEQYQKDNPDLSYLGWSDYSEECPF